MIRYFRKVIKYFWVIILAMVIFSGLAAVNSFYFEKDTYEGNVSVYIYQGASGDIYRELMSGDMLAADISNIIKSDYIIDEVKASVPAYTDTSNRQITENLETIIINNTRIIQITMRGENPENIAAFLGALSTKMEAFTESTYGKKTLLYLGRPKTAAQPVSPQPRRDIILGAAVGLVFGLLVVFLIDCVQRENE